uniref:Uncharacterized protein n=1 Tax=Rheinheimera sp. BAL341 TaxID=1708203 RepID=A0A486XSX6_9GAMM
MVALDDHRLCEISASISSAHDLWHDRFVRSAISHLFPNYMSVEQLCKALRGLRSGTRNVGDLGWHLRRLISMSTLNLSALEQLRDNFVELVSEGLRWHENDSQMTSERPHLSGILAAICGRGLDISKDDRWLLASVLALRLDLRDHYDNESIRSLNERLSGLDARENERLFWIADSLSQKVNSTNDPWKRYAEATDFRGPVQLRYERDLYWVKQALSDITRAADERAMLLEAAIRLTPDYVTRKAHIEDLKPLVADTPSLGQKLNEWLKPSKYEEENRNWKKKQTERNEQEKRRKVKDRASWVQFWREVANHSERAFSSEKAWNTAWNLWRAMSQNGSDSRASGWNRRFLEEQFNPETADRLRLVLMKIWRNDHPTFPSERSENERNTFLTRWQLGLAAIYAEAEDRDWATKLTSTEALLAARYIQVELNGFPLWIDDLAKAHPNSLVLTLGKELTWEFDQPLGPNSYSTLLQCISGSSESVAQLFLSQLTTWLDTETKLDCNTDIAVNMLSRIRQVLQLIVKHGTVQQIDKIESISRQKLAQNLPYVFQLVWLSILLKINPQIGIEILTSKIENIEPAADSEAVRWFASLFGDRQDSLHLSEEHFPPEQLLRLIRLAYQHVRIEDDAFHEGSYSPDTRDDAEWARNRMVTALFNTKGEDGWSAKLEMAADPLCSHFKDRILAVASEHWAQEIDADAFNESQAVALDKTGEAPATSNEAMFAILKDRLSDLDELLLLDSSPREAWAGIHDERVMRREIARELRNASRSIYTVDQEAVTADEKETDIRLRSTLSKYEAVIELKLADKRSATDLLETIENQLVKKYMAAEHCKSGALLITLGRDRKWQHPIDNQLIGSNELMLLLQKEAERVQENLGGGIYVAVHLLDLRIRLPIESKARS